jgi:hypothetical protein
VEAVPLLGEKKNNARVSTKQTFAILALPFMKYHVVCVSFAISNVRKPFFHG